jgi:RNA polymerase sigma-70 factor (ECF subfamily)
VNISYRDQDLLKKLREGDNDAFEIVYHTYFVRLHRFADEYLNDSDSSKDVIQNTFAKLWQKRTSLRENTNIAAWLFAVTKNEILSLLEHRTVVERHRQDERMKVTDANYLALKEMKLSEEAYSEINDILQSTIAKMSPQCRAVFECSRFRMMSNRDIAGYLSISVKTVETHMTRALKILRTALSDFL